jgi:uncharacterized protein DUF5994
VLGDSNDGDRADRASGDFKPACWPGSALRMFKLDIIEARPEAVSTDFSPVRLRMRSATERGGFVDGGWWPRSLDLSVELPPVLAELYAAGYAVDRVGHNLIAWQSPPKLLTVCGKQVTLNGFRNQNKSSITLIDTANSNAATVNRLELVVIPPDTDTVVAERALRLAGQDGYRFRAAEILQQARYR